MRKIIYAGIAIIAMMVVLAVTARIARSARLTVGTTLNFPPFEYFGGQQGDEIIGFDIDIAQKIARNSRMRLEIKDMPFSGLLSALEDGAIDFAIAAMPITAERTARVDFSRPYYTATQIVVTRADEPQPQAIDDLRNRRIAARAGTTGETVAIELTVPNTLLLFRDTRQMFDALIAEQADAIIVDSEVARYYVEAHDGALIATDMRYETIQYGIAVGKGNAKLLDTINRTINAMRDNDEYNALLERHIVRY